MKKPSIRVTFVNEDSSAEIEVEASPGELLTQAAYRAGVIIQQTCGGTPSCTDCKVKILGDQFLDACEAPTSGELRLLGNIFHITRERLSCQAILRNSSKVLVPDAKKIQQKASERNQRWLQDKRKQVSERRNPPSGPQKRELQQSQNQRKQSPQGPKSQNSKKKDKR